jgi:hypothetical protein
MVIVIVKFLEPSKLIYSLSTKILFFFSVLGFELRASHLLGRCSYCLGHSASLTYQDVGQNEGDRNS